MKLTYLGTAAAEGFPAVFCNCKYCVEARRLKGKNIRTRSQSIVNDDLLIDLPADTYHHFLTNDIDGYKIKPVDVVVTGEDESGTVLKFTLFEGRNRQIRKMCEAAELTVKRLSRISIGNLKLDGLPVGKWRYLEQSEVDYLYKATKEQR